MTAIEQTRIGETKQVVGRRSGVCFRTRSGTSSQSTGDASRGQIELAAELLHMARPVVYCATILLTRVMILCSAGLCAVAEELLGAVAALPGHGRAPPQAQSRARR